MPGKLAIPILLLASTAGCYTVEMPAIDAVPSAPLPLAARVDVDAETAEFTYDVRSWSAGIANRWRMHVGAALAQYADAYLRPAFADGSDGTVAIRIESFDVEDFESRIAARFILSRGADTVVDRTYRAAGKGYYARTFWGGPFAMKSSMRQSLDEALRSLFEQFLADARAAIVGPSGPVP